MNTTTQTHTYPPYAYAGFWIRFLAYVLDMILISIAVRVLRSPLELLGLSDPVFVWWHWQLGLTALVAQIYFVLLLKKTNGQSIGKMAFGLRVVHEKEITLSWRTVLIRETIGRYILNTISLLYLIVAFTAKKQHPVDILLECSVVRDRYVEPARKTIRSPSEE